LIKTALISTYDKTGIIEFARTLQENKIRIISTGGTGSFLRKNDFEITEISEITGFPEILDGRVKSLHPVIYAGILALRDKEEHNAVLEKYKIEKIDMVVVNLYPFSKTVSTEHTLEDAIENIDIGGPSLIRGAAKNYKDVVVLTDPADYNKVSSEIKNNGDVCLNTKKELAVKAFAYTASYDIHIYNYFSERFQNNKFTDKFFVECDKIRDLRYGENPHQKGAFYRVNGLHIKGSIGDAEVMNEGKELSFNNILDINSAIRIVAEFEKPCATIVKHVNPCSVACADTITEAYNKAYEGDPMSAFGGIFGFNRKVNKEIAEQLSKIFIECIAAPDYEIEALEILKKKKNIRIIKTNYQGMEKSQKDFDIKKVSGGVLIQDNDEIATLKENLKVVSNRNPTDFEYESMLFGWRLMKYIKSNTIVFTKGTTTVGIGAGQMSRVDAVKIAAFKSNGKAVGASMASDAFFPFRDGIDEAHKAGITAVIHPGGSIRDKEIIDAVNEYDMAMIFTGIRHFNH